MARRLLTPKKQQWMNSRKNPVAIGSPLKISVLVEDRYNKGIQSIIDEMLKATEKEINYFTSRDITKKHFAMDAGITEHSNNFLSSLLERFTERFERQAWRYSEVMAKEVSTASNIDLKSSLKKMSGGLTLKTDFFTGDMKESMDAIVYENVDLIKTIPQDYFKTVRSEVFGSIADKDNLGLEGLKANLHRMLDDKSRKIKNKAHNLATDQTRKAYNNLNRDRMKKLGMKKFRWIHSGGGRVPRKLHKDVLNGNIYSFDDLPIIEERTGERGIPGQAINCKCTMQPILDFGDDD